MNPHLGQLVVAVTLVLASTWSTGASRSPLYELELRLLAQQQPAVTELKEGASPELYFRPLPGQVSLQLWSGQQMPDWSRARFLVCDLMHTNNYSAIINLDFFRKTGRKEGETLQQGQSDTDRSRGPRISPKIGVLPGLKTRLVFPLSHLDAQQIFMARSPRQLKGTVSGSRLERDDVGSVHLRVSPVQPPEYLSHITIYRVFVTEEEPESLPPETAPYVDQFGQWSRKEWPGKIRDEADLKRRILKQEKEAASAAFPAEWSRYGGWKQKRFEASGFFRTQHDGRRWWLVDPEGFAFLSAGMDCVRPGTPTTVRGQEDLFEWLPAAGDRGGVDFLVSNLERVYGAGWRGKWDQLTTGLLKQAAFNTIANWSDLRYARSARLPYVLPMSGFPRTKIALYRDFPDVFSGEYAEAAVRFAAQLADYREDPYLIGYFLSNEPHWAFGKNNLAFEMFATAQPSATKEQFVRRMREKYQDDIARFNAAWELSLTSFEQLATQTFRDPPSVAADADFWEFSGTMAEKYVAVPCDAVKAVDPNHLNLGMRYAWISSDLLYRAGQRFDVFSINGYSFPGPPDTAEVARRSGKPVMIGEFHFGATDRGLPATGIQGTPTQQERAKAYRYYVEQGFARPELIGLHYFQWLDQPVTGRFDGENYNIGFLDICHQPYPELMDAARLTHERMYRVGTGEEKPFAEKPARAPAIFY